MLIILVAVKFFVIGVGDLGLRPKQKVVSIESPDNLFCHPPLHPNPHTLTFVDQGYGTMHGWASLGSTPQPSGSGWRKHKESPPSFIF